MSFSLGFLYFGLGWGFFGVLGFVCVCVFLFNVVGGFFGWLGFLLCFFVVVVVVPGLSAPRCQLGCVHTMHPFPG